VFLTAAATAVLLALSGCASDSSDAPTSGSAAGGKAAAPEAAQQGGAGPQDNALGAQGDSGSQVKVPDNLDVENRSIIYAGTMTVRVKDVDAAAAKAIAFATGAGGFIGGDNRTRDDVRSQGTLTLRVPAAKFTQTLDQFKTLGNEENRQVTAQDVTDQVVDVASRLQTAQASVDRIRALLARAQTIGEITSLESELSRRESDLESLQARKRRLDGLTALSTITLVLLGPEAALDKEDTGLGVGLRNGWAAFKTSLEVALTVLGWLVPWLLLLGLPIYLLIWALRRFRPKRPVLAMAGAGVRPAGPPAGALPPFPGGGPASGAPGQPMPGRPSPGRPVPPLAPLPTPTATPTVAAPVSGPPSTAASVSGPPSTAAAVTGAEDGVEPIAGAPDGSPPVSAAAQRAGAEPTQAPADAARSPELPAEQADGRPAAPKDPKDPSAGR
jgi:hypothetical protein